MNLWPQIINWNEQFGFFFYVMFRALYKCWTEIEALVNVYFILVLQKSIFLVEFGCILLFSLFLSDCHILNTYFSSLPWNSDTKIPHATNLQQHSTQYKHFWFYILKNRGKSVKTKWLFSSYCESLGCLTPAVP